MPALFYNLFMDDNYDDGSQSPAPESQGSGQGEAQGKTCLLPKSAFPDAKPGDSLSVQVVAVHGEEIEVTPDNDDQDGGDPDDAGQAPELAPSSGGIGDMMQ